jgi:Flp pilus assembly pilin Flp
MSRAMQSIARDTNGAVFVEYLTLLAVVTVVGGTAIAGLGLPLLRLYRYAEMLIVLPIP